MQFLPLSMKRHAPAANASPLEGAKSAALFTPTFVAAVVAFVVAGTFFVDRAANAGVIGDIMALVLAYIFQMIAMGLGQLLLIVINGLIWVYQYNGFVTAAPVANGWTIVRDVTNMFFILVLLVIAFGTILGVQNYSYKNNNALTRLLIMAVVVNFSRTICGLLIDFAQVVMLTFVYGFKEAAGGNFATALSLTQMMQAREITESSSASGGSGDGVTAWNIALAMLLAAIMVGIALCIVILMTITVAIRIVYLWLLVVISPLAFFLKAVPGGAASGYYAMWWKMFTSQVIVGPVMAFFLWLALVSVSSNTLATDGFPRAAGTGAGAETVSGPISQAFTDTAIESFIISICLMFGGLQLAKQISSESAGAAPGLAKKAISGATRAAKAVGRTAYNQSPTLQRGVDSALSAGTKLGVPLAKEGLIATRKAREAKMKSAQGDMKYMRPDELGAMASKRKIKGTALYGSTEGMVDQKEALREKLKQDADKGPGKDAKPEDVAKFRDKHFQQKKELKQIGGQLMDTTVDKDLAEIEKKRPSLIINERETDPNERSRQEKKFRDVARGVNASKIADMSADELDEHFLAFANPKSILEAQKSASGDQYDRLSAMGASEEAIRAKQDEYRARPENFGIMSQKERADLLGKMDPSKESTQQYADRLAATVSPAQLTNEKGETNALAQQIANAISSSALGRLPQDVGNVLRPLVATSDMGKALQGGATLSQAVGEKHYDSVSGNFKDGEGKQKFDQLMAGGTQAGNIPVDALQKNGGMNDVAISVVNNVSGAQINALADGKPDSAAALAEISGKLAEMSTLKEEDIQSAIKEAGLSSSLDDVKKAVESSKGIMEKLKQNNNPVDAQMKQQEVLGKIAGSEERNAARIAGAEGRITGRKNKGRKRG